MTSATQPEWEIRDVDPDEELPDAPVCRRDGELAKAEDQEGS